MKYKQEVYVSADYFYKILIDSARHEIKVHGGIDEETENLEGVFYSKNTGQSHAYEVEITKDQSNKCYAFVSKTKSRIYSSEYQIESMSPTSCRVTYIEEMTTKSNLLQLNDIIVGMFLAKSKKRRIRQLFTSIEEEYKKQL